MRDNGLNAEAYVAVADLDPRTAHVALLALARREIAAYTAASDGSGPRPDVERLFVDVSAEREARDLVGDIVDLTDSASVVGFGDVPPAPSPDDRGDPGELDDQDDLGDLDDLSDLSDLEDAEDMGDLDAAIAALEVEFHRPTVPQGGWPAQEDIGPADPGAHGQPGSPVLGPPPRQGWDDLLRPEPPPPPLPQDEERYVPPPPPPLPKTDAGTRAAWVAVLGGPALLFVAVLFGWHLDDWLMLVCALAFLGGFVALVARLGDRSDEDGDDGAVV
jgi:hypothetical protein